MEAAPEFCCQVCLGQYDSNEHRPLLLPACGHSFCAFCLQQLERQGKTYCPKCRKDKAVQSVSSLPVNYSLLEIIQNKTLGDAAANVEMPSKPMEQGAKKKIQHNHPFCLQTGNETSPLQLNSSSSLHVANEPSLLQFNPSSSLRMPNKAYHQFNPPDSVPRVSSHNLIRAREMRKKRIPSASSRNLPAQRATNSLASGNTSLRTTVAGAHNLDNLQNLFDKELQDESDFQLAIHLTFCKNWNHDLNQHARCPEWQKLK